MCPPAARPPAVAAHPRLPLPARPRVPPLLPQWLMGRPERHLAVVSHSSFIFFMLQAFGHTAAPAIQTELHKWWGVLRI